MSKEDGDVLMQTSCDWAAAVSAGTCWKPTELLFTMPAAVCIQSLARPSLSGAGKLIVRGSA
jgi:hypothetical protein